MVLGVDGLSVFLGVGRDPVRDRPGRGDPLALETQIPVQAASAVFLDDEARRPFFPPATLSRRRLPGDPKVTLALVLTKVARVIAGEDNSIDVEPVPVSVR
jgi:hypothetical protein